MSTAFLDISAALSANLNTYAAANSVPVAWQNVQYTPITGAKYLRETLQPGDTKPSARGSSALDLTLGSYQVDAFTLASSKLGKSEAIMLADGIADQFKRGTVLNYNGVKVTITDSPSFGTGSTDGAWFIVPVHITFKSYTQPRV
tara:strand:+ start:6461 stop:6895 length:435 start_codon:yes stop_codon:yes gene_type:complete